MLCYAMLCYNMLCSTMLFLATLCHAMLCLTMLRYVMLCYAILICYAMLYYVMPCHTMLCSTMLCYPSVKIRPCKDGKVLYCLNAFGYKTPPSLSDAMDATVESTSTSPVSLRRTDNRSLYTALVAVK